MNIIINGTIKVIDSPLSINKVLSLEGYQNKLVAVAINNHFIARPHYDDHMIKDNDIIEIVAPMQGG